MINPQWLIGPGVGAVIGYITNEVAVRMLFRPREPKYLFGRQLPFTPGLIPKSRKRLSQAVGDLVGSELLNAEVLRRALLSDAMLDRIGGVIDELCANAANDGRAARELLPERWGLSLHTAEPSPDGDGASGSGSADPGANIDEAIKALAGTLSERLLSSGFEAALAESVVADLRSRITTTPFAPLRLFWDDRFHKAMTDRLSKAIRDMACEHGAEWIETIVKGALNESLDTKVSDWYRRAEPFIPRLREEVMSAYARIVSERLDRALSAIDLGAILRAHIDSLDAVEMERMILRVMKRELRAIVWLGALLGAVMGIVNALISV
ncbi:MAG: DUF445 family protein [Oscillospiraceae bacterium]|jgi:uncharacterized membrane protein YheB (UPF0754 family)|nr:DUF445 family protein [Oscillospiraceae bacterium]